MKISELKSGDKICALERHRKTMIPIVDVYMIASIDTPRMEHLGNTITEVSDFILEDQEGVRFKVTLEIKQEGSICDRVFYTPNIDLIAQEIINSKRQAEAILNNRSRYENVVMECDRILNEMFPEKNVRKEQEKSSVEPDFTMLKKEISDEFKPYFDKVDKLFEMLSSKPLDSKEPKNNKPKE